MVDKMSDQNLGSLVSGERLAEALWLHSCGQIKMKVKWSAKIRNQYNQNPILAKTQENYTREPRG